VTYPSMTFARPMPPVLGTAVPVPDRFMVGSRAALLPADAESERQPRVADIVLNAVLPQPFIPELDGMRPLDLGEVLANWWTLFTLTLRVPTPNWELPLLPSDNPKPTG